MRRTYRALAMLALGLALVGVTTAAATAMPPTGTQDQADQRKALYQSELERTLARHRALGVIAAQPAVRTDPAAPSPGVDVLATLLVGLVGGLLGGVAAMIGWTATTRRGRPRAAAGT
jgi:C4-dicarboxylate-specific signal transduction histidine kinase